MTPALAAAIAQNDDPIVLLIIAAIGVVWGLVMARDTTQPAHVLALRAVTVLCAGEIASGVGQMWTRHLTYSASHLTYLPEWAAFAVGYGVGLWVMQRRRQDRAEDRRAGDRRAAP